MSVLAMGLAALALASPVPAFEHVVVIVFENQERASIVGNPAAPTFARLAREGAQLTRYYGVAHPSLPNYLALVSGSTQGMTSDCSTCTVDAPSLADSLEGAGKTWKAYAENLPYAGFDGAYKKRYARRHVPFLYFRGVDRSRVVPLRELARDISRHSLPDFSLLIPDLCDDMHDCGVEYGDAWLRRTVPPLLRVPGTAIFVVFDEGTTRQGGGGHLAAYVVGTAVRPGSRYVRDTGHYGVLRTVEAAWGLPLLGESAVAAPITGIWRRN